LLLHYNKTIEWVLQPKFVAVSIQKLGDNLYQVQADIKFGLLYCYSNKEVKWLLQPEYENIEKLGDYHYLIQADKKFGLIYCYDDKVEWIIQTEFENVSIERLVGNFYRVQSDKKIGVVYCYSYSYIKWFIQWLIQPKVREKVEWILKPDFDSIDFFENKLLVTIENGKAQIFSLGLLIISDELIIKETLMGHHTRLEDSNYLVKIDSKQGLWKIDKGKQKWILPPKYEEIIYLKPNVYLVSDGKHAYLFENGELKKDRAYTGREIVFVGYVTENESG